MRENLPKEMDFTYERDNAIRTMNEFKNICTSLYIRKSFPQAAIFGQILSC